MSYHQLTIDTYNKSADGLANYFHGHKPRLEDIKRALELAGNPSQARVVEIGCGDGQDARNIIDRVDWYQGIDPSKSMLDLARQNLPTVDFLQADALNYDYPKNLDVVYAFASLLHINKDDVAKVCQKVAVALRPGGIFCVDLKEKPTYQEALKDHGFGPRMFYYYHPQLMTELAGSDFELAFGYSYLAAGSDGQWFMAMLRRAGRVS